MHLIAFPQVEYEWMANPYQNMINNEILCNLYEKNAAEHGLNLEKIVENGPAFSTDMGNLSHLIPSIHPIFNIGTEVPPHTRGFATAAGEQTWKILNNAFFQFIRVHECRQPAISSVECIPMNLRKHVMVWIFSNHVYNSYLLPVVSIAENKIDSELNIIFTCSRHNCRVM